MARRGKLKREEQTPVYKRRRRRALLRVVLVFVFIAIIVGLVFLYLSNFTNVFKPKDVFFFSSVPYESTMATGGNNVYFMRGTNLVCADYYGNEKWTSKFSAGELNLVAANAAVCVFDDYSANVFDPSGNVFFTVARSDFKIISIKLGNKTMAIYASSIEDPDSRYMLVYDYTGKPLSTTKVEDEMLLKYGIFGTNDTFWTLSLVTKNVLPVSQITTSNPIQNKITGVVRIDDQLVSDVYFRDLDMYLLGTIHLYKCNTFGVRKSDTLTYGLACLDTAEPPGDIAFLFAPRDSVDSGMYFTARIITDSGKDSMLQLPEGVFALHLSQSKVYCFAPTGVYIYNFNGIYEQKLESGFLITGVKKLSDSAVLLQTQDNLCYYLPLS